MVDNTNANEFAGPSVGAWAQLKEEQLRIERSQLERDKADFQKLMTSGLQVLKDAEKRLEQSAKVNRGVPATLTELEELRNFIVGKKIVTVIVTKPGGVS